MKFTVELIKKAYKKLKCSVYFDKTQLILRDRLVEYESKNEKDKRSLDEKLSDLFDAFVSNDEWEKKRDGILEAISYHAFPKEFKGDGENGAARESAGDGEEAAVLVCNAVPNEIRLGNVRHFIDMEVEGHILGVLWLLLVGWRLDEEVYEDSYGNRMRRHLREELQGEEEISYSPYLFEPYFQQYESWRDTALETAQKRLNRNQDILVFTMDFHSFYYSVDMDKRAKQQIDAVIDEIDFSALLCEGDADGEKDRNTLHGYVRRLNDFVFRVIDAYSELFDNAYEGRHILPIGFLPSNVLSNWSLYKFDKAVTDGWNPLYYGRYVDDIIIVEKVEKNSELYQKTRGEGLCAEEILQFYLEQCTRWNGINDSKGCKESMALFREGAIPGQYVINRQYTRGSHDSISLQNKKVKIFYFKFGESDALLRCFRNQIIQNKSEFRFLPEDEAVFCRDDYSEIYDIDNEESINKLRDVNRVRLNKFSLSKFLGKYQRIGGLVSDKLESKFAKDITKIFNNRTILENYTTWEKVLQILVVNEQWDALGQFVGKVYEAMDGIKMDAEDGMEGRLKVDLTEFFLSAWTRALSHVWGKKAARHIEKMIRAGRCDGLEYDDIVRKRKGYLQTKMYDKYTVPVMLDVLGEEWIERLDDSMEINLCDMGHIMNQLELRDMSKGHGWEEGGYIYYPYIVTMYDIYIARLLSRLEDLDKEESGINQIRELYVKINYVLDKPELSELIAEHVGGIPRTKIISVGAQKKAKLRVAIANTKLDHGNFERLVKGEPNRSYERYRALSKLINQSIDEKADMLVLPEACVPVEWLSTIARTCARNHMGVVTGLEHIIYKDKVFNFTAVILPYHEGDHSCAVLSLHLKNHYAPLEKEEIHGYRYREVEGSGDELYHWTDCWFPVYCCFELASIQDRSLFLSYADMMVAVEWNRDVNYYSNILEALSRDIHCYCVQVNSSDYGDSRITFPTKTEMKDILKTKGGMNDTILVGTIDVGRLREFQLKEYNLQKMDPAFKPTPPLFDKEIVRAKIRGKLLEKLVRDE